MHFHVRTAQLNVIICTDKQHSWMLALTNSKVDCYHLHLQSAQLNDTLTNSKVECYNLHLQTAQLNVIICTYKQQSWMLPFALTNSKVECYHLHLQTAKLNVTICTYKKHLHLQTVSTAQHLQTALTLTNSMHSTTLTNSTVECYHLQVQTAELNATICTYKHHSSMLLFALTNTIECL